MKILGIIPARYNSTRFPGKPLADICGKSMIQRVYERALMSPSLSLVAVATDDQRIFDHVRNLGRFGYFSIAVKTDENLPNGTARCEQALRKLNDVCPKVDAVINIQGDEPLLDPVMIDEVAEMLADGENCATLCREIRNEDDMNNPNVVKVVMSQNRNALYFSRSLIPYNRTGINTPVYQHIGIYGYRAKFLREYVKMNDTPLSMAESLEQLKILENGYRIRVKVTSSKNDIVGVDTPEDLEKVRKIIENAEI